MDRSVGEALGRFIGDMVNTIERGEKDRVQAMDVEKVASAYALKPAIVAAYRALQLGEG